MTECRKSDDKKGTFLMILVAMIAIALPVAAVYMLCRNQNSASVSREKDYVELSYKVDGEKRTVLLPDTDGIPCVFYITEGDGKMWIDFIDPTDPDRKLHTVQLPGKTVTLMGADGLPITYIMDNGVDNEGSEGSTAVEGPKPITPKGGK